MPTADKHQWDEYPYDSWDDWMESCCTRRNIVRECSINHFSWFGLPKSVVSRRKTRKQTVFCRVRKTWHDIEQREMIFWGTLSFVLRCGCIITSRSLSRKSWSGEILEKQNSGNSRFLFWLGKLLQRFSGNSRDILLTDFLHERRTVNAEYYCQILDEVKLTYRRKRQDVAIRNTILLRDNVRPHTTALTREKLGKIPWNTTQHPPYSPDLSPRDYHMFGPLEHELREHRLDDETLARNWLQTRPNSSFDDGIKEKCVSKRGDYVEN